MGWGGVSEINVDVGVSVDVGVGVPSDHSTLERARPSSTDTVPSRRWLKSPVSQTDRRGNGVQRVRGGKCAQQQVAEIACKSNRQKGEWGSEGQRGEVCPAAGG